MPSCRRHAIESIDGKETLTRELMINEESATRRIHRSGHVAVVEQAGDTENQRPLAAVGQKAAAIMGDNSKPTNG